MVYPVYLLEPLTEASSVFLIDERRRPASTPHRIDQ
jgi:hypothetical protein